MSLAPALDYARDIARHCAPTSLAMLRHQLLADAQSDLPTALAAGYRAMTDAVQGALFAKGSTVSWPDGRRRFPACPATTGPSASRAAGCLRSTTIPASSWRLALLAALLHRVDGIPVRVGDPEPGELVGGGRFEVLMRRRRRGRDDGL